MSVLLDRCYSIEGRACESMQMIWIVTVEYIKSYASELANSNILSYIKLYAYTE